ncbi:hypothetical protein ACOSQ2_031086 [Xanthoceras sorbifolium]
MGGSMADSSQHDLRLDSRKKMLDAGKETNSKPLVAEKQEAATMDSKKGGSWKRFKRKLSEEADNHINCSLSQLGKRSLWMVQSLKQED